MTIQISSNRTQVSDVPVPGLTEFALASSPDGNTPVTWSNVTDIFFRIAFPNMTMSASKMVNVQRSGNQFSPDIVYVPQNKSWEVTWSGSDGSSFGVLKRDATLSGLGPEEQVNSVMLNDQSQSSSIVLPQGSKVRIWGSFESSRYVIKARLFGLDDQPLSGEFQVNDASANHQLQADGAPTATGFGICWQDAGGAAAFCRGFDNNAGTIGNQIQLNTLPLSSPGFVKVAHLENKLFATFVGSNRVHYRLIDTNATHFIPDGPESEVHPTQPGAQGSPDVSCWTNQCLVVHRAGSVQTLSLFESATRNFIDHLDFVTDPQLGAAAVSTYPPKHFAVGWISGPNPHVFLSFGFLSPSTTATSPSGGSFTTGIPAGTTRNIGATTGVNGAPPLSPPPPGDDSQISASARPGNAGDDAAIAVGVAVAACLCLFLGLFAFFFVRGRKRESLPVLNISSRLPAEITKSSSSEDSDEEDNPVIQYAELKEFQSHPG